MELKEETMIAERERQEEVLTSLRTTRKTKHSTERPPVSSTAGTTKVPSPKRPKHSSPQAAKPTEKVKFFLHSLFVLFYLIILLIHFIPE